MSRLFYHVMQDNVGNLLFDVSGTMRVAGSGTLATIYGDEELTVVLPNPMTNHVSFGSFKCYLGAGAYDFYMAKAGYTFETLTGVQGHGTMALQNANAVAITGGTATLASATITGGLSVDTPTFVVDAVNNRVTIASAKLILGGLIGLTALQEVQFDKNAGHAIVFRPTAGTDAGSGGTCTFLNATGVQVGAITQTASATAYNTSSDGRLKDDVAPLRDALATIQALRPVAFRWKGDGTPGQGFIAQEAQAHVPQAVVGDPESPEPTMQMDHSKLVVWLCGAVQELAAQVEGLTSRLAAAGG